MNGKSDRDEVTTLGLLETIEQEDDLSQRRLASKLGVALGLANSYLKRCTRKGWVKMREAPANRYLYYLTPKGFSEKSRLTAKYLSNSLAFYRKAGDSCLAQFDYCQEQGWQRVLLCGLSDLSEIAALRALEIGIEVIGVYDFSTSNNTSLGKPVWHQYADSAAHDACLLTTLESPIQVYDELIKHCSSEIVLVPDILGLDYASLSKKH